MSTRRSGWFCAVLVVGLLAGACRLGAADLEPSELEGVWELRSMEAGGRASVIEVGRNTAKTPYVEIGARIQGSYGCNRFGGSYSIDGGTIVPGEIGGELALCLDSEGTERMYTEEQLRPMLDANLPIVVTIDGDAMTWASIGRTLTFARIAQAPTG